MKKGVFQMRKDKRFDAMQERLARKNIGKNQTDRVMTALELLCDVNKIEVPA
jgi:hypothetical protein